jgi:group I intron endonuclease
MLPEMTNFQFISGNKPLARPGVYMIQNGVNGKRYIGISKNIKSRAKGHLSKNSNCTKLKNALNKYGVNEFYFIPMCYSVSASDVECLPLLEAELIQNYETTGSDGYNICAAGGKAGPYGAEFSEIQRQNRDNDEYRQRAADIALAQWSDSEYRAKQAASRAEFYADPANRQRMAEATKAPDVMERRSAAHRETWAKPEFREKMREIQSTPEYRLRQSETSLAMWADPEFAAMMAEKVRATWADPDLRAAQSARQKEACKRPEVLAKKSEVGKLRYSDPAERAKTAELISNLVWITDGEKTTRIAKGSDVPEGWRLGRLPRSEESRRRTSESLKLTAAKKRAASVPANDNEPADIKVAA